MHLIELDLLRGGHRLPMAQPLPPADYYAIVSRASRRPLADVWAFHLADPLPVIPVPLVDDADARLDLQKVFAATYTRVDYSELLDYNRAVEPPLDRRRAAWACALLDG